MQKSSAIRFNCFLEVLRPGFSLSESPQSIAKGETQCRSLFGLFDGAGIEQLNQSLGREPQSTVDDVTSNLRIGQRSNCSQRRGGELAEQVEVEVPPEGHVFQYVGPIASRKRSGTCPRHKPEIQDLPRFFDHPSNCEIGVPVFQY